MSISLFSSVNLPEHDDDIEKDDRLWLLLGLLLAGIQEFGSVTVNSLIDVGVDHGRVFQDCCRSDDESSQLSCISSNVCQVLLLRDKSACLSWSLFSDPISRHMPMRSSLDKAYTSTFVVMAVTVSCLTPDSLHMHPSPAWLPGPRRKPKESNFCLFAAAFDLPAASSSERSVGRETETTPDDTKYTSHPMSP